MSSEDVKNIIEKIRKIDQSSVLINNDEVLTEHALKIASSNAQTRRISQNHGSYLLFDDNTFHFKQNGNGTFILGEGWLPLEKEGCWSKGCSTIFLKFKDSETYILNIHLGFSKGSGTLGIKLNDQLIKQVQNDGDWNKLIEIILSPDQYISGIQTLTFESASPTVPSGFLDKVGIFLREIHVQRKTALSSLANHATSAPVLEDGYNAPIFQPASLSNEYDDIMYGLNDAFSREYIAATKETDCPLPENTSFRFFKRVIRKVIRNYTFFQSLMNQRILNTVKALYNKTNYGLDSIRQVQNDQNAKTGIIYDNYETLRSTVDDLTKRLNDSQQSISKLSQELGFSQQSIRTLSEELVYSQQLESLLESVRNINLKEAEVNERIDGLASTILKNEDISKQRNDAISHITDSIKSKLELISNEVSLLSKENGQLHGSINSLSEIDNGMAREIHSLWSKIVTIDKEFSSQWDFNKNTNDNFNSLWQTATNNNKNFDSIWNTYNSLRRELFYELDHRLRNSVREKVNTSRANSAQLDISPIYKSGYKQKMSDNDGKIRLNLGSGPFDKVGYISVDARDLPNVDLVSDVSKLPFQENSIDEIFSAHMLEHFSKIILENELLPYWYSLLRKGGIFTAIVPDLDAMARQYVAGDMPFADLAEVVMGAQDYALDYHYAVFSPEVLIDMLKRCGFDNTCVVARARKNGQCYETEITAIK